MGENFKFGGGLDQTVLHPVTLVVLFLAIVLVLFLPKKYVIVPFLLVSFLVPLGQQVFLLGVHLYVARIIILTGWIRLVLTKFLSPVDHFEVRLDSIDKLFLLWAVLRALAFTLLYMQPAAAVNQAGFWLDALGGYFLLRFLIQDEEDICRAIKVLAAVAAISAICMVNERFTQLNVFGFLGGFPTMPELREGQIRAQGPFSHSILAGCFGATLVPLFFWLWKRGKSRLAGAVGIISSTVMVLTSVSSTPVLAYAGGVFALLLWPIRKRMRMVRWGIVLALASLALFMKAPVWFVIAHLNVIGSSSGWDRAVLIDQFYRHFGEWWLLGAKDNASWGFDMWDRCNQFVSEGETGGLLTLICFILLISRSFGRIGTARKSAEGDLKQEWLLWALGAVMFSHLLAFFGVSYFDQTQIWWYAFLAIVSAATAVPVRKLEAPLEMELLSPDFGYSYAGASSSNRHNSAL